MEYDPVLESVKFHFGHTNVYIPSSPVRTFFVQKGEYEIYHIGTRPFICLVSVSV